MQRNIKVHNFFLFFITVLFSLIIFDAVLCNIFYNQTYKLDFLKIVIFSACIIIFFIVIFFLKKIIFFKNADLLSKKIAAILFFLFLFVFQIIIAFICRRTNGWDCGVCYDIAIGLVYRNGYWRDYLIYYPNNHFIIVSWYFIFKVLSFIKIKSFFVCILMNVLMMDLSVFITYKLARKLFNSDIAFYALVLSIPICFLSPYLLIPYTDTLSMSFLVLNFWLFIKLKDENKTIKKIIYSIIFGVMIFMAFKLKPTNIIVVLAIIIIKIPEYFNPKSKILYKTMMLLLVISSFSISNYIFKGITNKLFNISNEEYENYSFEATHFIKMGLREPYGMWNAEDVNEEMTTIGKANKVAKNCFVIKQRLKNYGFIGYIKFLQKKFAFTYTDGNFFYGREGQWYTSPNVSVKSGFLKKIQAIYEFKTDEYVSFASFNNVYWFFILLFCFCTSFFSLLKHSFDTNTTILETSIIGITLFLLLFEARSRYLINHIPVFVTIAALGIKQLENILVVVFKKSYLKKS